MMEELIYKEITQSELFKREKQYLQHGNTSVYEHSLFVAETCIAFVNKFNINVNKKSLIKGALLHDYFLYDWHDSDPSHKLHGIRHPKFSRDNAKRDFGLNKIEENMILAHMFPLGIVIPKYKESIILCLIDKYCAAYETLEPILNKIKYCLY